MKENIPKFSYPELEILPKNINPAKSPLKENIIGIKALSNICAFFILSFLNIYLIYIN